MDLSEGEGSRKHDHPSKLLPAAAPHDQRARQSR